ncbi:YwdI family protein [Bacillus sp. FJAT-27251]|uniref:YwdI family protein n=1 Tax=Bacillus sp. FJAT-27251 TaxID=1684142 RepID=UPI0006A77DA3|nr:YwdI family protein [Bacillus sp. FJAT-27251]
MKRGDGMNISLEKLLAKMEDELKGARNAATDAGMREKIHSLKTLCELVLDEPSRERPAAVRTEAPAAVVQNMQIPVAQAQPQPQYQSMPNQQKRLEMDNEANGESLFDF